MLRFVISHLSASCKMALGSMLCSRASSTPAFATSMMGSWVLPSSMIITCGTVRGGTGQWRAVQGSTMQDRLARDRLARSRLTQGNKGRNWSIKFDEKQGASGGTGGWRARGGLP